MISTAPRNVSGVAFVLFVSLIVVFLIFPVLVIIPVSFNEISDLRFPPVGLSLRWYRAFIGDDVWLAAFATSLKVAIGTVFVSASLGTTAALAMFNSRSRIIGMARMYLLSPLVTPVIVLAIGIFMVFSQWRIAGTMIGLVLAHSVLAIPMVIVTVTTSLHTIPPNLATAASGLGANPLRTFFRVTLPLLKSGVFAGAVFAFITSWDEAVISLFLSSPEQRTLPVVIWSGLRTGLDPTIAAVGSILILTTAIGLILAYVFRPGRDNKNSQV